MPKENLPMSEHADLLVRRSWQRCTTHHGLEPYHTPPPSVLSQAELKEVCARAGDLIHIARFEIDRLFTHIGCNDYVVLLTDMQGITVDFRCSPVLRSDARKSGLHLGAIWSEAEQGTNGIGTCVYEARPLSIIREEHFSARNAALTCTVAPIFAAENRLIGVLDVATERATDHASQVIMRNTVAAAAQRIENSYFEHRHVGRALLRLSPYRDFADSAAEARLALAENGTILEAGSNAARFLADEGASIAGREASSLLCVPLQRLLGAAAPVEIQTRHGGTLYARIEERQGPRPRVATRSASSRQSTPNIPLGPRYDLTEVAGSDPAMLTNADVACRMINRGLPVVISGETGSGKGLFAQALHAASKRSAAPFVTINCAAIPAELIESELFGYRPGAFTGAAAAGFKGRLLQANTGTVFLDEIGDMSLALQTRLLQVLSDGEFTPVGAVQSVALDVAIVSATLHDLPQRVRAGQFREDLFFRLSGVNIAIPPLRQRKDRASLIRKVFEEEASAANTRAVPDDATLALLTAYYWPGNLRELRHMARFAVALAQDRSEVIRQEHLPAPLGATAQSSSETGSPADTSVDAPNARIIRTALQQVGWNVTAAAALLGISRATLHRKIRKLGLQRH
jgi:sigma-54 dependent transcriptional regulator, acetoin dehydrogenase operon transcriptional activator AcoR